MVEPDSDSFGDKVYLAFTGTLQSSEWISATIPLYAKGFGNGGLMDISIINKPNDVSMYFNNSYNWWLIGGGLFLVGVVSLVALPYYFTAKRRRYFGKSNQAGR